MKSTHLTHLIIVAALAMPGIAWSAQCDEDLAKANLGLNSPPKADVTADDMEKARGLISKATALLADGDDVGCVAAAGEALDLMGLGGEEG